MKTNPYLLFILIVIAFSLEIYFFSPFRKIYQVRAKLCVSAEIEKGSVIDLFVNSDFVNVFSQKIVPNELRNYCFENVPYNISFIRLDLSDVAGSKINLQEIFLVDQAGNRESIKKEILVNWPKNHLETLETANNQLILRSTGNDPFIYSGDLALGKKENHVGSSALDLVYSNLSIICVLLTTALIFFSAQGFFILFPIIIFSVVYFFLNPIIYHYLENFSFPLQNPAAAIGNSLYSGYPKVIEQVKLFSSLILVFIIAMIIGRLEGYFIKGDIQKDNFSNNLSFWFLLLLFVSFFVLNFPSFEANNILLANIKHSVGLFDSNNIFTWDFLANSGYLPYRDYWFPYGGDYLELGNFPEAVIWRFIEQNILFLALLFSVYEIFNRNKTFTFLCLVILGFFIDSAFFLGTKRYLISLSIIVSFFSLYKHRYSQVYPYVLFGVYLAWAFSQEPSQLLYAIPGVILILGAVLINSLRSKDYKVLHQFCFAFISFIFGLAFYFYSLHYNDQLKGFIEFYSNLGGAVVSCSVPASINKYLEFKISWDNILYFGMNLFFFVGVILIARNSKYRDVQFGLLILGISLATFMIFQKMLIRPHMAKQVICLVYFNTCFFIFYLFKSFNSKNRYYLFLVLGIGLGILSSEFNFNSFIYQKLKSSEHFFGNISLAYQKPSADSSDKAKYYSYENFVELDGDNRSALEYIKEKNLPRFSRELFVLGDSSYYYIALNLKPCPYISLYDSSALTAQKEQVNCLEQDKPQYVVWDSSKLEFDSVPNILRNPLIFQEVIENYVLEKSFGKIFILKRKSSTADFDWTFWFDNLGKKINLGALPWISNFSRHDECPFNQSCHDFLVIEDRRRGINKAEFDIKINEENIRLEFVLPNNYKINKNQFLIFNLNRLWFYDVAKKIGILPEIIAKNRNLKFKIIAKAKNENILY